MMKSEATEQATPYGDLFVALRERVNDDAVALAVMHELSKDRRMDIIRAERGANGRTQNDGLVTVKQKAYLKQLGVTISPGLTKAAASELIDQAVTEQ